jgi:hypothetical protein
VNQIAIRRNPRNPVGYVDPECAYCHKETVGRPGLTKPEAVWFLDELEDSAPQAIVVGKQLVADRIRLSVPTTPASYSRATNSPSPTG